MKPFVIECAMPCSIKEEMYRAAQTSPRPSHPAQQEIELKLFPSNRIEISYAERSAKWSEPIGRHSTIASSSAEREGC
jgi:hypothetical protein